MTAVLSSDLSTILAHAANGQKAAGGDANLSDILAAVWLERVKILDAQIVETSSSIQNKNTYIHNLNAALRELRINRPKGAADKKNVGKITAVGKDGKIFKVVDYIDDGLFPGSVGEEIWNQAQFDEAIEWLSAKIDLINNQSQLDMVRLQSLINKRNQSIEELANTMNKFSKSINEAMKLR